ncbi:MAG: hypothetical protein LUP94_00765, partial [Candidatus Methanomethylicus sp.]|nr:hypothetical protein [Candidatus Methanomethylicus sp.]
MNRKQSNQLLKFLSFYFVGVLICSIVATAGILQPVTAGSSDAPVIMTFNLNKDQSTTTSQTVTLDNTCTNNPTEYMASENPSFVGA